MRSLSSAADRSAPACVAAGSKGEPPCLSLSINISAAAGNDDHALAIQIRAELCVRLSLNAAGYRLTPLASYTFFW